MGRQGKSNPGRQHLRGADVTGTMQRQYTRILQSLRDRSRYDSEAKRKQVAAATVRKLHNPGAFNAVMRHLGLPIDDASRAEQLSEEFHGRPVREIIEIEEEEVYDTDVSVLGLLKELEILMDDEDAVIPIRFSDDEDRTIDDDTVWVVSNVAGTNIEFIGGDQNIDWRNVDGASDEGKYLVWVGAVYSITYHTDKHHLSGPRSQANGTPYNHLFADEGGDLPCLIFDRQNQKLLFVGGNYRITPEGIAG